MSGHLADAPQPEHPGIDLGDAGCRVHAEEHPADHDEHERRGDAGGAR
jgi:hypothetical protein